VSNRTKVEGPWPDVWVGMSLKSMVSISLQISYALSLIGAEHQVWRCTLTYNYLHIQCSKFK